MTGTDEHHLATGLGIEHDLLHLGTEQHLVVVIGGYATVKAMSTVSKDNLVLIGGFGKLFSQDFQDV